MSADYRTLGLSVPVSHALDPALFREYYAPGVALGAPSSQSLSVRVQKAVELATCGDKKQAQRAADLIEDAASTFPDTSIRWHLRTAMSQLELKLGVNMGIQVVKSEPLDEGLIQGRDYDKLIGRLPYTHGEALDWFRLDMPHSSVISIERVRGFYYGTKVWEISSAHQNADLLRLEWKRQGVAHILPINLQSIAVTQGGNYGIWETIHLHRSPIPDFWAVDYTTGPVSREGKVGELEAVLADWIYSVAGIKVFSISGLAQSQGLTSLSTSFDGVSKSIGLQASAIYGINSALENVLKENEKRIDWKSLRAAKRGIRIKKYSH